MAEFLAPATGLGQRFCFVRRNPNGHFQRAVGGRVIVAQSIGAAQVQQDSRIGWIEPVGPFEQSDGFLIVLASPSLGRVLE